MAKIFFLVSRIPYPLEKGDKLRAYHQLKELSKTHEVVLCCLSIGKADEKAVAHLREICTVEVVELNPFMIPFRLLFALFSSRPFQVHYFYQHPARRKIHHLIDQHTPDHIYCQLIRCSEYVKHIHHIPKTIDYMDAFNKGMERLASVSNWLKRQFWLSEAKRLVRYENLIFDYFDHHTIISEQDKQLIYHQNRKKIAVVPNGVDTTFFAPRNEEHTFDIVFTGNMSYLPNVDSAEYLVRDILPLILSQRPQTKILLAGATPSPRVKALASANVEVSGWLDDIRDAYAQSTVFVAPMRIGTGLQNKLLEAMSMELPCLTSELANNALDGKNGEQLFVCTDAQSFANETLRLLENPILREEMGKSGRLYVQEKFSWAASSKLLTEIMFAIKS
jgi:polysaccharide biosynthesis protein PslH